MAEQLPPEGVLSQENLAHNHPSDEYLKPGRIPHIWCSGCGIGIVLSAVIRGLQKSGIPRDETVIVSGIGCTARSAGYMNVDSYHTTHGRAIPFAVGVKLANPKLKVIVISGEGDLSAIGGNHLIHAARRNLNMDVICVNNFNYGMTGGQVAPSTPIGARTATTPYGNFEPAFNLPSLVAGAGAAYVARWTSMQPKLIERSVVEALATPGFTFTEVVSACITGYARSNKLGTPLDIMKNMKAKTKIDNNANLKEIPLTLGGEIVTGRFVKNEVTDYLSGYDKLIERIGGRKRSR